MPNLMDPISVGALSLPNRIIMAPLTRCRSSEGRVPNDLMREYYVQRASAGMILSEATSVDPMGVGYPDTPGIWSDAQINGWSRITEAVHKAGGRILLQLWHVGRVSDPLYLNGSLPIAPSAVAPSGTVSLVRPQKNFVTPRALKVEEIPSLITTFRKAAQNAQSAGFDGVEIHGANGYLLDQFLQTKTNQRSDDYGGTLEKRARFMLEVVDAVVDVWGAMRVGLHLAPRGDAHDMGDEDPLQTFSYVAREASKRKLAFLCVREALGENRIGPSLRKLFTGTYIANERFTPQTAQETLMCGEADAVAFGQLFIANPDLPRRIAKKSPLNKPNPDTFYSGGRDGYVDYPFI
ncbi:MAG: alkene reductase [Hyphomicrobium sp.]